VTVIAPKASVSVDAPDDDRPIFIVSTLPAPAEHPIVASEARVVRNQLGLPPLLYDVLFCAVLNDPPHAVPVVLNVLQELAADQMTVFPSPPPVLAKE